MQVSVKREQQVQSPWQECVYILEEHPREQWGKSGMSKGENGS